MPSSSFVSTPKIWEVSLGKQCSTMVKNMVSAVILDLDFVLYFLHDLGLLFISLTSSSASVT